MGRDRRGRTCASCDVQSNLWDNKLTSRQDREDAANLAESRVHLPKGSWTRMRQLQRRGVALLAIGALLLMGCTPGWAGTPDPIGRGPVLGGVDGGPPLGATP